MSIYSWLTDLLNMDLIGEKKINVWNIEKTRKMTEMVFLQTKLDYQIIKDLTKEVSLKQKLYAYLIELFEVAELYPYKWWKKQEFDRDSVVKELVDCLHFALSYDIQNLGTPDVTITVIDLLNKKINLTPKNILRVDKKDVLISHIANISEHIVDNKKVNLTTEFYYLVWLLFPNKFDILFDEIYKGYIGKNALNSIRKEYGYGTKNYPLIDSVVDNLLLQIILRDLKKPSYEKVKAILRSYVSRKTTGYIPVCVKCGFPITEKRGKKYVCLSCNYEWEK